MNDRAVSNEFVELFGVLLDYAKSLEIEWFSSYADDMNSNLDIGKLRQVIEKASRLYDEETDRS